MGTGRGGPGISKCPFQSLIGFKINWNQRCGRCPDSTTYFSIPNRV
ncbi:hypothetical protein [Microcystis phage LMM01]|uniref:Uncharacterized protein n=1 Tax=Microcystis phage LMM01 TaxID=2856824 RepID=A0A7G3_9CAUD|nr:hypothetical protein MaLMM01_gp049 [Microcystis phage LMM01]BAF36140.1 hypothetical protein [Microcystis phage LMM01]